MSVYDNNLKDNLYDEITWFLMAKYIDREETVKKIEEKLKGVILF